MSVKFLVCGDMIILDHVPDGIEEIVDYYGDPKVDDDWFLNNMIVCRLPFSLRQSWNQKRINKFHVHKLVAPAMKDALLEIEEYAGIVFLRQYLFDQWGGVYADRNKRGSNIPSTHSFGISIDECPELGPIGEPSRMPYFIVHAFLRRGFENLKYDGMHFQACIGY